MKRSIIVLACLCFSMEAFGVIQEKGTYTTNGIGYSIDKSGNYVFVAAGPRGLFCLDVSNVNSISYADSIGWTNCDFRGVSILGSYAYVSDFSAKIVVVVDISTPTALSLVSADENGFPTAYYEPPSSIFNQASPSDIVALSDPIADGEDYIYVACGARGVSLARIDDASAASFTHIAQYDSPGYGYGVTVSSDGGYTFLADGTSGLRILDSNPIGLSNVSDYNTYGTAFEVSVSGDYAYVSDGSNGLVIVDISTIGTPDSVAGIKGVDAQDVYIDGDYAYIADRYNRLSIVNISDPTSPFFVDLWVYDNSAPVNAVIKDGNFAYVVSGAGGTAGRLRIAQVNDLAFYKTFPKGKFELIGIPTSVIAAAQNPISLFGDNIDNDTYPIGEPNWRWSRWDNDRYTYVRYGEIDADSLDENQAPDLTPPAIEPGLGYWLRQDVSGGSTVSLDILEAQLTGIVDQGTPYVLPLESMYIVGEDTFRGLNMMANPFPYAYTWANSFIINTTEIPDDTLSISDAATEGWISQYAYLWNSGAGSSGSYAATYPALLQLWMAYWVEVLTEDTLELMFIPKNYSQQGAPAEPEEDDPLLDWELQLEVARIDREYLDPYNIVGVKPESRQGYDRWDAFDYAPFSNRYLRLYFPHPDWPEVIADKFSYDYRAPQFEEPEVWEFKVETRGLPRGEYRLSWPNLDEIHEAYTFELQDLTNNVRIANLREELIYDFEIDPEVSNEVDFCLRVSYIAVSAPDEAKEISPTEFGLINLYPNPFNDVSLISFRVPASMEVTLGVYDLGGRLVRNLHQGQIEAGLHQIAWDASGENTGLYFIRLESEGFSSVRKAMLLR